MQDLCLIVAPGISGRLDSYLASQKIASSRSQIERWIKEGHVLVNGNKAKTSTKIKKGDQLHISIPKVKPSVLTAEEHKLDILFEDADIIVLNKSPHLPVHPGAGRAGGTLVNALLHHCRGLSQIGGVERPGIVHRLDKGTSGALVIAKNDSAHLELSRQFKDHEVKKIYWAMVYGTLRPSEGTISSFIVRSPADRKKFIVSKSKGKKAVTHYRVLKSAHGLSLVEVQLETGRTHQIRVHLTDKGHSIVGDPQYGGHAKRLKQLLNVGAIHELPLLGPMFANLDHTLLHARVLGFKHPRLKKWMEFKAEVPENFRKVLEVCFGNIMQN